MNDAPLIQLKNICKTYPPEVSALSNISLSIYKGEFISIIGKSGSGKSTLMNILGFLDYPTAGQYLFRNQDASLLGHKELTYYRRNEIGFVFQSFNLLPRLSALKNIALPLRYSDMNSKTQREKASALLDQVGLSKRANHHPHEISGGERQRVAIARALANDPSLIIADEPTGNLDSNTGKQIMDMFRKLHDEGKTLILVTHDDHIANHAERIIHVHDGQLVTQ